MLQTTLSMKIEDYTITSVYYTQDFEASLNNQSIHVQYITTRSLRVVAFILLWMNLQYKVTSLAKTFKYSPR